MKIVAISGDGQYYKIGETFDDSKWYVVKNVLGYVKGLQKGDEVEIKYALDKSKNRVLSYIKKVNSGQVTSNTKVVREPHIKTTNLPSQESASFNEGLRYPDRYMSPKTPQESERIKRLSIFDSVCVAVAALAGQVDENGLSNAIEKLYDKFYKKISE